MNSAPADGAGPSKTIPPTAVRNPLQTWFGLGATLLGVANLKNRVPASRFRGRYGIADFSGWRGGPFSPFLG